MYRSYYFSFKLFHNRQLLYLLCDVLVMAPGASGSVIPDLCFPKGAKVICSGSQRKPVTEHGISHRLSAKSRSQIVHNWIMFSRPFHSRGVSVLGILNRENDLNFLIEAAPCKCCPRSLWGQESNKVGRGLLQECP